METFIIDDIPDLDELKRGDCHRLGVVPICLLFVVVLDLGVDRLPIEAQAKVWPVLHDDFDSVSQE
jgi:hypothetical protein